MPKGFFPQQDTGQIVGGIRADQSISFQLMEQKFGEFMKIIRQDPAVENVVGFTGGGAADRGGGATNTGNVFIPAEAARRTRGSPPMQVIDQLRTKLGNVPGARLFLSGGRTCAPAAARATAHTSTPSRPTRWTN